MSAVLLFTADILVPFMTLYVYVYSAEYRESTSKYHLFKKITVYIIAYIAYIIILHIHIRNNLII